MIENSIHDLTTTILGLTEYEWESGDLGEGLKGRGEGGRGAEKDVELNKKQ